jgi:hypothetical protein
LSDSTGKQKQAQRGLASFGPLQRQGSPLAIPTSALPGIDSRNVELIPFLFTDVQAVGKVLLGIEVVVSHINI